MKDNSIQYLQLKCHPLKYFFFLIGAKPLHEHAVHPQLKMNTFFTVQ